MYVNKKMKLNRFENVAIPRNCDYFARVGKRETPVTAYAGDIPPEELKNKLESIADYDAYDKVMQEEELKKKGKSQNGE